MRSHGAMNRVYRLVWSTVHHLWIAVSELCSSAGRAASSSPQSTVLLVASAIATGAFAAPTGGQVVSGDATISQTGNTGQSTTTINQTSQLAKLHWQSFNVGSGETVNFVQPSSTALAVNRILDTQGSQIMGRLNANGQVWLINPNGVLFGKGAQINVGGLVASTLDVQGAGSTTPVFSGNSSASVENQGSLQSAHGGYVALIAHKVNNQGGIHTPGGSAVLGAGSTVRLQMTGNRLLAVEVQQNQLDALAANAGLIQADGGQVLMSAGARDSLLASAVNNTGIVQARTIGTQAGKIMLLGGMAAGTTQVSGTLDASAPNGGDGGFIETSAAKVNVSEQAVVTTLAPQGQTGTWLIDPKDFEVNSSNVSALSTALRANNLTIHTENTGTNSNTDIYGSGADSLGNIYINVPLTVTTNYKLTLSAYKDIYINEPVTLSTRSGGAAPKLILKYGQGSGNGTIGGTTSDYYINAPVTLPAGVGNFQTQIGTGGTLDQFFVITGLGSAGDLSGTTLQGINGNLGGLYALGADIDASSTAGWNLSGLNNKGWNNLGNTTNLFRGTFAGLGHKVSGLYLQRPSTAHSGMFGAVGSSGLIRDLGLTNVRIENYRTGGSYTGGLAGKNSGTIKNSFVSGIVLATKGGSAAAITGSGVGGFVGFNEGDIIDCYSTASVTSQKATGALTNGMYTGAFVGENASSGKIRSSYAASAMSTLGNKDFIGLNAGTLTDNYFDYTAAGATAYTSSARGVTGLSATDALNGSKYLGFSFSSADSIASPLGPWFMPLGVARPTLRWSLARATVDISITGISKTYDGNTSVPSGFNSNGVLNGVSAGDTVSVSFSAVYSSPNAGSGIPITFTPTYGGNDLSKYRIVPIYSSAVTGTIRPKDVTITTSAWNSTYDGVSSYNTLAAGMLFSSTALVGLDSISTVTQTPTGVNANFLANAGSFSVTSSNAVMGNGLASNYNFIYSSVTYTVGKAALTVTGNSLITTYNGTNQTVSGFTVSGLQGRDTEGDLTSITASGATGKNAGSYVNTVAAGAETNYTVSTVNGILNIAKADATVTANSATLSYNGADQTVGGFTASGLVGGDTSAVLIGVSASLTKKNAGTYTTSASGSDSNYNLRFVEGSLVIDKASLIATGNSLSTTYNGANQTVSGFTVSGLQGTDTVGSLTNIHAPGVTGKNAGSYSNIVMAGTETNYTVSTVNGRLDIAKADATVTANSATLTYNGADQTVSGFTATGLVRGETEGVLTGVSASLTKKNAGTYTTIASGSDSNYNLRFVDGSLVINKASLTATGNSLSTTYNGTNQTVSGFTVSGLQGGDTEADLTSITAGGARGKNAGSYANAVTAGTETNYTVITVNGSLNIAKADATVTANSATLTYNGADQTVSGFRASGLAGGETSAVLTGVSASLTKKNAGTYTTSASGSDINYNLRFVDGSLVIDKAALTVTGNSLSTTYNGANQTASGFTVSGLQGTDTVGSLTNIHAPGVTGKNAGSYSNIVMAGTESNYTVITVNGRLDIAKADATVKANSATLTYNGTEQTISGFTASGLVGGETEAVLTGVSASLTKKNAGTYTTFASGSDGNYNLRFVDGSLVIDKATLTVTGNSLSTTYNGTNQTVSGFMISGLQGRDTEGDLTSITVGGARGKNAGSYANTVSAGTETNYTVRTVNGSLDIAKADATVTANSATLIYNGADQTVSGFTATGLAGGETSAVLTGVSASLTKKNAGTYTTSASGSDSNYNLSFVDGSLVIDKAHLTVSANNSSKTYGGLNPALSTTLSGFVIGEDLGSSDVTGTGLASTSADQRTGAGAAIINASVGSLAANNYDFTTFTNGTLTITKRPVTVHANDLSKTYGDSNPTLSYIVDADRVGSSRGLVNGDVLAGNLSTTATRTSAVGEYLIDASALANPLANTNYLVTANNGKLTVETVISINSPQPESPSTAPVLNTPDVGMLKYFQPLTNNLSQEGKRPQCLAISVEFATPSLTESGSTGFAKPCVIVLPAQKTGALQLDLTQTLASYKVLSK